LVGCNSGDSRVTWQRTVTIGVVGVWGSNKAAGRWLRILQRPCVAKTRRQFVKCSPKQHFETNRAVAGGFTIRINQEPSTRCRQSLEGKRDKEETGRSNSRQLGCAAIYVIDKRHRIPMKFWITSYWHKRPVRCAIAFRCDCLVVNSSPPAVSTEVPRQHVPANRPAP
jgi:hypothetical protein